MEKWPSCREAGGRGEFKAGLCVAGVVVDKTAQSWRPIVQKRKLRP